MASTDLNEQTANMTYDAFNNLTAYSRPGKDTADQYRITYSAEEIRKKRHLPITTTTPEGVATVSVYDEYGNCVCI